MKKDNLPTIKLDDNLRAIMGVPESHNYIRTADMIKGLWNYIKANDLKVAKPKDA